MSQNNQRPKALDLFCKAGGSTKGLQQAGFFVAGIDIEPQSRYCGDALIRGDVFEWLEWERFIRSFDFIWAGPRCQRYSVANRRWSREYPDQIDRVREQLKKYGIPYCIENVPGAPLINPVTLCGQMFGLKLTRHRLFETSFPVQAPEHPPCHGLAMAGEVVAVHGHGCAGNKMKRGIRHTTKDWREAMGIDWMVRDELSQAIPPAYSEYIGKFALQAIQAKFTSACEGE